ncbi:MAG: hypothetical protein V1809_07885 [Planctomycetota bacterium]
MRVDPSPSVFFRIVIGILELGKMIMDVALLPEFQDFLFQRRLSDGATGSKSLAGGKRDALVSGHQFQRGCLSW